MTPRRAAIRLGLALEGLDVEKVNAAFAAKLRAAHPDTGGAGGGSEIKELKEARNLLRRYLAGIAGECIACGGTGRVHIKGTFMSVACKCTTR